MLLPGSSARKKSRSLFKVLFSQQTSASLNSVFLRKGGVVQSPIKLEFLFRFCNFSLKFSVYSVCPSVMNLTNLILHKT